MSAGNRKGRGDKAAHKPIIVKKVHKGHAGHHGGAWKVAFADFTLAMMALFMTLWIMGSVSKKERSQIVAALYNKSVFHGGGLMPLNNISPQTPPVHAQGKKKVEPDPATHARASQVEIQHTKLVLSVKGNSDNSQQMKAKNAKELKALAEGVFAIAQKANMMDNIEVEILPQGLRVLIKDDKHRQMYAVGSSRISPYFEKLLKELTPVFDTLDNNILVTGHTDALQYRSASYNNWNLSGERALAARQIMEEAGMPQDKVLQVNAMADQTLLNKENPKDEANRRIEIMILTKTASETLRTFFGQTGDKLLAPSPKLDGVHVVVPPSKTKQVPLAAQHK